MSLLKQRRASSILALALDNGRLEGFVLRRGNGSVKIHKSFDVALSVNPVSTEPDIVAREIRNHLDQAGIRERRCAVCLPLSWALTVQAELPDLPEADIQSFLEIESERGFPYAPEALYIKSSRFSGPGDKKFITLVAVPRTNLLHIEKALKGANLNPVSFSLGISSLQIPEKETSNGVLALLAGESGIDLQITLNGGVAVLRSLEGMTDGEGSQKRFSADTVAREIRITLGQMPDALSAAVKKLRVIGQGELARKLFQDLAPKARAMGLVGEMMETYPAGEPFPTGTNVSPALSLGARLLKGPAPEFEFRPPKVNPLQQMMHRFASRKLAYAGGAAAVAVLAAGGVLFAQYLNLSGLEREWASMAPSVKEIDLQQQKIRQYRGWFDDQYLGLTILRKVTEAFPVDGAVSAKTLEIRNLSTITCTGSARDNESFRRVHDQLRGTREITNLKVDQLRGTPMQFTFNFQWTGGGREN